MFEYYRNPDGFAYYAAKKEESFICLIKLPNFPQKESSPSQPTSYSVLFSTKQDLLTVIGHFSPFLSPDATVYYPDSDPAKDGVNIINIITKFKFINPNRFLNRINPLRMRKLKDINGYDENFVSIMHEDDPSKLCHLTYEKPDDLFGFDAFGMNLPAYRDGMNLPAYREDVLETAYRLTNYPTNPAEKRWLKDTLDSKLA